MLKKYVPLELKCVPFNMVDILMVSGLISGNVLALLCSELFKKLDTVMR